MRFNHRIHALAIDGNDGQIDPAVPFDPDASRRRGTRTGRS